MFCNKCGAQVDDGTKFCPTCGADLQQAPQQPAYQQPVYQAQPVSGSVPESKPILVFGILAIAFACSFYFAFMGIIFGAICSSKVNAYVAAGGVITGKAKVGKILGKVGLILGIVLTALLVISMISCTAAGLSSY